MTEIVQKWVKLAQKCANLGIFNYFEVRNFSQKSLIHRQNRNDEPGILNYFLWCFIVGKSVYTRQNGAKSSRWKRFLKITTFMIEEASKKILLAISRKISGFEKSGNFSHDQQIKIFNFSQQLGMKPNADSCSLVGK